MKKNKAWKDFLRERTTDNDIERFLSKPHKFEKLYFDKVMELCDTRKDSIKFIIKRFKQHIK